MGYKHCKRSENRTRATRLRGVYIPHFGQIWEKISVFVVLHPCRCTDGSEIWHGGGDLRSQRSPPPWPNFIPIGATPVGRKTSKSASG